MSVIESIFGVGVTTLDVIKAGGLGLGFFGSFLLVWFVSKSKAKSQVVIDLASDTKDLIAVLRENVEQSKLLAESNEQRAITAEEVAKKAVLTAKSLAKELTDYRDMQVERDRVSDENQSKQTEMLETAALSRQETNDKLAELEAEIAELKELIQTTGCNKMDCSDREVPKIPGRRRTDKKKEN